MTEFDNEPILSTTAMVKWWRKWASKGKPPQFVHELGDLMEGALPQGTMLAWWGWDGAEFGSPFLGIFQEDYWLDLGWDEENEVDVFIPTIRVDWLHGDLLGTDFEISNHGYSYGLWNGLLFIL